MGRDEDDDLAEMVEYALKALSIAETAEHDNVAPAIADLRRHDDRLLKAAALAAETLPSFPDLPFNAAND